MSHRVIIGLHPGADWNRIKQHLTAAGANWARDPSPTQPDVLVVSFPDEHPVADAMERARKMPGVRYVERDAMSGTL